VGTFLVTGLQKNWQFGTFSNSFPGRGNRKRMTRKEYKIEFTLTVVELDTDWWEAELRDHSGFNVVCWATTEQLAIEQVSAYLCKKGAFDKIKIKSGVKRLPDIVQKGIENGCVGSLPGSAS